MSSARPKARLEANLPLTEQIQHHRKFEELIAKVSTTFIKVPIQETDGAINEALRLCGQFAEVDRAYLVLISDDRKTVSMTHEWCSSGTTPVMQHYSEVPVEGFRWLHSRLMRGDAVRFREVSELPAEAREIHEIVASGRLHSAALVPLLSSNTLQGLIGFSTVQESRTWTEDTISMLRFVSEVVVNAIQRRRSEEALHESESRYRILVESLGEGILLCDREDTIIHVNSRMAELAGYPPDEMIGKTAYDLIMPKDERHVLREKTLRRLQGISEAYTIQFQRKDGTRFWAEIHATPIRDREGHIIGTLGAVADISHRKQATEALEASEKKYRDLVETSGDLIWSVDAEGKWTFVNQAAAEIYGYAPHEMVGKPFTDFLGREVVKRDLETFQNVLSGRAVSQYETQHVRKDGKTVILSFNAIVLRDANGKVIGTTGTANDITKRREAERKLRKSEERFRRYFDLPLIGMAVATADGLWMDVNKRLCEMLGFTRQELLKKSWAEVTHPEDRERNRVVFEECKRGERDTFSYDKRFIAKDGKIVHVSVSGGTVRRLNGTIDHFVALFQDISARKEAEDTSIRLQKQLLQSQKMEAIGQLAAGIAHDLNNALAAVVGHLQLIGLQQEENIDLKTSIDVALNGCQRATSLIEQLLGFSRQGRYNLQEISLQGIVKETIQFLKKIIGTDIRIELIGQSQDLMIRGDASQLQQAITNLIINAKQAMPNGGTISFQFGERFRNHPDRFNPNATPGNFGYVNVLDTGIGIPPENLDKVFEPFFTTKTNSSGTGLGLAMVYGIMQSHGGWVEVDSIVGYGSTFSLFLPLIEGTAVVEERESSEVLVKSSGTILVIDDEKVLVDLAQQFLKRSGFTSFGFSDVYEALAWYKDHFQEVDMVILDMKMPGMDGKASFLALREINPNVKVVILSGYSQDGAAHEVLESGAMKFFQKPLKYPDLVQWIAEALGGSKVANEG